MITVSDLITVGKASICLRPEKMANPFTVPVPFGLYWPKQMLRADGHEKQETARKVS